MSTEYNNDDFLTKDSTDNNMSNTDPSEYNNSSTVFNQLKTEINAISETPEKNKLIQYYISELKKLKSGLLGWGFLGLGGKTNKNKKRKNKTKKMKKRK